MKTIALEVILNKQTPQQRQYERRKGQPKITGLYISHEEKAILDAAVAISGGIKAAIFDGLRLVVADQEKSATWISVDDTEKPIQQDYQSDYLTVTVLVTDGVIACECTYAIGGNHVGVPWGAFNDCIIKSEDITHWMPLPTPPKEQGQ